MTIAHDVVLMTTHDIGRHLYCYGVESAVSPHLDALAAGGVLYMQAFATAPQCSPSRASLATGLYPHDNGVMGLAHRGFDWELSAPHTAAILAGQGFESHLFIGQHVTQHPDRLGFSSVHQLADLDRVLGEGSARLYLEINFEETHRPYPPARDSPPGLAVPGYLPDGPEAVEELTAVEQTITEMDAAVGRVMSALDQSGRGDDALVVFTTDHGLAMPRAKCTLYDPGLEVALILSWRAGDFGRGVVNSDLHTNLDVLPTMLEAVGAPAPEYTQGQSLFEPRPAIFAEKTFHSYYDPMRCIRTQTHKFIRNFETAFLVEVPGDIQQGAIFRANPSRYSTDRPSGVELYDLDKDPWELYNLAGDPRTKDLEERLSQALWAWMRETNDPLLEGPVPSPRYREVMGT